MSTEIFPPAKASTTSPGVVIFATGGTIDKSYPTGQCGAYGFEFGLVTGAERIRSRSRSSVTVHKVLQKDSQDLTDEDRQILLNVVLNLGRDEQTGKMCCVITHGTDTIIETAKFLNDHLNNTVGHDVKHGGIIVLTGAFIPEQMKNTDADFNLGFAAGCAQMYMDLTASNIGVKENVEIDESVKIRLAFHGQLFSVDNIERLSDGSFVPITK